MVVRPSWILVVVLGLLAAKGEGVKKRHTIRRIRTLEESRPELSVSRQNLKHSTVEEITNQVCRVVKSLIQLQIHPASISLMYQCT